MSGANLPGRQIRKGSAAAIEQYVNQMGGTFPSSVSKVVESIASKGATPLVVAEGKSAWRD